MCGATLEKAPQAKMADAGLKLSLHHNKLS